MQAEAGSVKSYHLSGCRLLLHSSRLPSTLGEQPLIVELLGVAPKFTDFPATELYLLSVALVLSENGGQVLPAILLCGVRTFLFSH